MKIFFLCNSQSNQIALANKIHKEFKIKYIFAVKTKSKFKSRSLKKIIKNLLRGIFTFFIFRNSWFKMINYYKDKFLSFPIKPYLFLDDINSLELKKKILDEKPDLVIVSGTNILKKELINLVNSHGIIINLHTGISPYLKGGPNCTNWALYLKKFCLIGNTVHLIDEGIDSGKIIITEKAKLSGFENMTDLHIKVMESGHDLLLRTIRFFINKNELKTYDQNKLKNHKLFFSNQWKLKEMIIALYNFYRYYNKDELDKDSYELININNL